MVKVRARRAKAVRFMAGVEGQRVERGEADERENLARFLGQLLL